MERNVQKHTRHETKPGSTVDVTTVNGSKAPEHESPIARRKALIFSQSQSSAPTNSQSSVIFTGKVLLKPFKTFFDLQELVDAKTQMFRNQPDVTFELFARVIYSSRENFYKKHITYEVFLSMQVAIGSKVRDWLGHCSAGDPSHNLEGNPWGYGCAWET
ncbi:Transcription factor gsfR2 [Fusarium oxysporum f. sp. albedinis]|nr:Transcription factor gsfR2 [Fusarium oxysporum f. sp. albedinis]